MDNMEAIEKLELLSNYLNPKWTETDSCKEALKMGTQAIKKQIEIKPIFTDGKMYCPDCGRIATNGICKCGQRLNIPPDIQDKEQSLTPVDNNCYMRWQHEWGYILE